LQLFVLQSADAPSTAMQHHNEWTSTSWRILRPMDPAGDLGAVSHLDLFVVFGDAFDFWSHLR
jgi:hypothetical protein